MTISQHLYPFSYCVDLDHVDYSLMLDRFKGLLTRDYLMLFFFMIPFRYVPDYLVVVNFNVFGNANIYSSIKFYSRCR